MNDTTTYAVNGTKKGMEYKMTGLSASRADYIRLSLESDGWTAVIAKEPETTPQQPYMTLARVGACDDNVETVNRPMGSLACLLIVLIFAAVVAFAGWCVYELCYRQPQSIPVLVYLGFGILFAGVALAIRHCFKGTN